MKKRLVFLARGIEILNQTKQSRPIKVASSDLTSDHVSLFFRTGTLAHPVMPIANGLGGFFIGVDGDELR